MKLNIATVVAATLLLIGGVAIGKWSERPTLDDLAERNRRLEQMDTVRKVELEDSRVAYVKLVRDYNDAEEAWAYVNDSLNNVANALKRKAEDDRRQIEALITANAKLRDSLDVLVRGVTVTDTLITAELYTYKGYQDGSIGADGYVSIYTPEDDEPYGSAALSFDIRMTPTVLISRDNDGLAQCDLSFGDMPVYVKDLDCVNNWDVDLPVRKEINWPTVGLTAGAVVLGVGVLALIF